MSLASHFKRKSLNRTPHLNLAIAETDTGEREQVSIGGSDLNNQNVERSKEASKLANPVLESTKGCFTIDLKQPGGGKDDDTSRENTQFTFGFDLQEGNITSNNSSKARKRRNRNKKKKKTHLEDSKEEPDARSLYDDAVGKESLSQTFINETGKDVTSILSTPKSKNDALFRTAVRTPPGFCSYDNKNSYADALGGANYSSSKPIRKTPGKLDKKNASSSQHLTQLQSFEQNAALLQTTTLGMGMAEERKLKFNTADKGRAMVNHSSLAVRKERTEARGEDPDDHNAFSFGFSFDSLLKDYL
eukprot:scaffold1851_cov252-Chaetoceros_neogracile.AAC.4